MDQSGLKEILEWMRTTDLQELTYKENGRGLSLTAAGGLGAGALPVAKFKPVSAPAVGIFQWAELGRARKVLEGSSVKAGDPLGLIEAGSEKTPVKAPCGGVVSRVLVDGGSPVDYGQPLLFIETAS